MNNLKTKLKAMWLILLADGFDMATTQSKDGKCIFQSISAFGKDNIANAIHNEIGNLFNKIHRSMTNK